MCFKFWMFIIFTFQHHTKKQSQIMSLPWTKQQSWNQWNKDLWQPIKKRILKICSVYNSVVYSLTIFIWVSNWIQHKQLLLLTIYNIAPPMTFMHHWGKQLHNIINVFINFDSIKNATKIIYITRNLKKSASRISSTEINPVQN